MSRPAERWYWPAKYLRDGVGILAFGFVWMAYAAAWPGRLPFLMGWLFSIAGFYVVILIHEFGHAFAAVACRHQIVVFAVRPVAWNLPNRSVILMARGYEPGTGGLVAHIPIDPMALSAPRAAIITAAGPLANIAIALAGVVIAAAHPSAPFQRGVAIDAIGAAVAVQSLWVAIASMMPSTGSIRSDGQGLWRLFRQPADWHATAKIGVLGTLMRYNVRLRDYPQWLLDELTQTEPSVDGLERLLRTIEVGGALDARSVAPAKVRALIDAFLVDYGDSEWLASCDAYFIAIHERDAGRARARLWRGEPPPDDHAMAEAANAAVAAVDGDAPGVAAHLDAMRRELAKRSPFADPTFRDITRHIEAALASAQ